MLHQPLGEQHHEDALAAALRVPDDAALALPNALLRRLHARELMRARHLLDAVVEDDEVADQVEQAGLSRTSRASGRSSNAPAVSGPRVRRLPFHEELLSRGDCAVAQPLRIAAREDELHRREEVFVENLLLVGDELAHAIAHLDRAAFQFDHPDGDAVQVDDQVGPALVTAAQGHFLGDGEVVASQGVPNPRDALSRAAARRRSARPRHSAAVGRCAGWPGRA